MFSAIYSRSIEFDKWSVKAQFPEFKTINIKGVSKDVKLLPMLLGITAATNRSCNYTDTVPFKGVDDNKNKFAGSFHFTDTLYEAFGRKGFFPKIINYQAYHFRRTADGYIITSGADSANINIALDYDNRTNPLNYHSFIISKKDSVYMEPAYDFSVIIKMLPAVHFQGLILLHMIKK